MRWITSFRPPLACLLALGIASCTGGPANNTLPAAAKAAASTSAVQRAKLALTIHVPRHRGKGRRFVSPSTQSMTLSVAPAAGCTACSPASNGDYGLTAQSPNCTDDSSGVTCQIPLTLKPGSYTGSIATYDGLAGCQNDPQPCNLLSQDQSFPITIDTGSANLPSITLSGVVHGFLFVNLTAGTTYVDVTRVRILIEPGTTGRVELLPKDADGNIILGPGTPSFVVGSGKVFAASMLGNTVSITAPSKPSQGEDGLPVSLKNCTTGCAQGYLFVAFAPVVAEGFSGGNAIAMLPSKIGSTTPLAVISNGIATPDAEMFDANGDLYVANFTANNVTEYAPPYNGAPVATLSGVTGPNLLASDSAGDVAVGSTNNATVDVYLHSGGSPVVVNLAAAPSSFAFDSQNNLWIALPTSNLVERFPATPPATPYASADKVVTSSISSPRAIIFDYKNGAGQSDNLYVLNNGGVVTVYDSASSYAIDGTLGLTLSGATNMIACTSPIASGTIATISGQGHTEFFVTPNVAAPDASFDLVAGPLSVMATDQYCDLYSGSSSLAQLYLSSDSGTWSWVYHGYITPPSSLGVSNMSSLAVFP